MVVMGSELAVLVEEVLAQGVLTSEAMYKIDQLLRQKQFDQGDLQQVNLLLQGLIEGRIRSQSPSVNLFLRQARPQP
ncbi:MAG: hypothetical protein Q6K70_03800 [Thermostichales cyanobacterium DRC_bins_46]